MKKRFFNFVKTGLTVFLTVFVLQACDDESGKPEVAQVHQVTNFKIGGCPNGDCHTLANQALNQANLDAYKLGLDSMQIAGGEKIGHLYPSSGTVANFNQYYNDKATWGESVALESYIRSEYGIRAMEISFEGNIGKREFHKGSTLKSGELSDNYYTARYSNGTEETIWPCYTEEDIEAGRDEYIKEFKRQHPMAIVPVGMGNDIVDALMGF